MAALWEKSSSSGLYRYCSGFDRVQPPHDLSLLLASKLLGFTHPSHMWMGYAGGLTNSRKLS